MWALLSDGRLPPMLSFLNDLESALATSEYDFDKDAQERAGQEPDEAAAPARRVRRRFLLTPYEAMELRRSLKLKEPLLEVMAWTPDQVRERMQVFRAHPERWGTDYRKLLVFVTGNLDEMYRQVATRVEDCDTDADIFRQFTSRLSLIDAKKALGERFKPEQIARLGNNHLIYPSLDRRTYERLIEQLCLRYADEVGRSAGLRLEVADAVRREIYDNAVFPAQGTRPLFSSVQGLLSSTLVNASLWALEQGAQAGDLVRVGVADDKRHLVAQWQDRQRAFAVPFDLNRLKQRTNTDFRALLAVHEAGHALVYALLLRQVPLEVKINVASFNGGYNSFLPLKVESRRDLLDLICVGLGGRAAELLVFGPNACTSGAEQDLKQATAEAAQFVRQLGFAGRLSRTDVGAEGHCEINTSIGETDPLVERILAAQYNRAQRLLQAHAPLLARLADALTRDGEVSRTDLGAMLGLPVTAEGAVLTPYAQRLSAFARLQA